LKDFNDPAGYQVEFSVTGNHPGGKPISARLGPFKFSAGGVAAPEPEPSVQQVEPTVSPEPQPAVQAAPDSEDDATSQMDEPAVAAEASPAPHDDQDSMNVNWYLVIGQVILINGLLIGGGFFAYKRWWRSEKNRKLDLLDDEALSGEDQPLASILEESKT
jgi:hypothetical protein